MLQHLWNERSLIIIQEHFHRRFSHKLVRDLKKKVLKNFDEEYFELRNLLNYKIIKMIFV